MRYLLFSAILLTASFAAAQTSSTPTTPTEAREDQVRSGAAFDHAMTVEGCLGGSEGNYTLTGKDGATYQLTGETSKLSDHVGHDVKVMASAKSPSGATETGSGSAVSKTDAPATLTVKSVKMVSKSCKNGNMAK